jgi:hypothetical protein
MMHIDRPGAAGRTTAPLALLLALLGCGGDSVSGPDSVDFPVSPTNGNLGCPSTAPTIYMIPDLADHVVDPSAPTLEARMRVGERVRLGVGGHGCGSNSVDRWTSTNPAAASISPPGFGGVGLMTGLAPGQTRVFADFRADNGKTYRTTLAYCPPVPGVVNPTCANPRKIDIVTIVQN